MKTIIYHNPRWSKSRESVKILEKKNKDFKIIEYLKEGISSDQIKTIISLLGIKPKDIIRKSEQDYKNLTLDLDNDTEVTEAITKYPKILERPIIINGDKATIGRPPEKILEIL